MVKLDDPNYTLLGSCNITILQRRNGYRSCTSLFLIVAKKLQDKNSRIGKVPDAVGSILLHFSSFKKTKLAQNN